MIEVKSVSELIDKLNEAKVTNQVELCDYCDTEKPLTEFEQIHALLRINTDKSWILISLAPYRCKECAEKGLTETVDR